MIPSRLTIIAKPTHDCNLRCKYCYVGESQQGIMSYETLDTMIHQSVAAVGHNGSVHFLWHGGEPLLAGLAFYECAVKLQERHVKVKISNSMQSNGTLFNDSFATFFKEHDFSIGISLDGPAETHNALRPYADGTHSFEDTLKGVRLAKQYGVGGGVIVVVNGHTVEHLDVIYNFLKQESINAKLNPLIQAGCAITHYDSLKITPRKYGQAMIHLFDRWFSEPEQRIMLDPFEQIVGNILTGKPMGCNYSESCQNSFISVGPKGDVYPCGRFDEDEMKLGNIHETSLADLIKSPQREKLRLRNAASIASCNSCDFRHICNGGCVHNAYMIRGNVMDKDYYCAAYKMMFTHILQTLHRELSLAEVRDNGTRTES